MDVAALQRALDETFDHAVVYHGFTDYMRDYEVIVYMTADPKMGIAPAHHRYLFRYCVEARCETSVPEETWGRSLDDRLVANLREWSDRGSCVLECRPHPVILG